MKIYNVLNKDDSVDTTATPFTDLDKAIKHAREKAVEYCNFPEDYKETNVEDWLFHVEYSCEGDCMWITEHEINE